MGPHVGIGPIGPHQRERHSRRNSMKRSRDGPHEPFTLREEVTQEYITRVNGKPLTLTVGTASITMIQK